MPNELMGGDGDWLRVAILSDVDEYEDRKVASDDVGGVRVSTAWTSDFGYETALCDRNGCHPVARYASREKALQGHARWMAAVPTTVTFIRLGTSDGWVDDEERTLSPRSAQ